MAARTTETSPRSSRRRFLRFLLWTGGSTLALAGGLFGGLLALRGRAPRVAGLRCLSDQEYRTLSRLAVALFPEGGAFPIGAGAFDLARLFDGFLADEPEWNRADLKNAVLLLEVGPVVFDGHLRTFSHLDPDEALAHFQRWQTSGLSVRRQVSVALRKFMSLVFYDQPRVWPSIGYDGPLFRAEPA